MPSPLLHSAPPSSFQVDQVYIFNLGVDSFKNIHTSAWLNSSLNSMFTSGCTKWNTSLFEVESFGQFSVLRVAARLSSCEWCWLSAWPILGWALQSGNSGSVGCRASHSPRPPQCRSGKWHYRACWSQGWEGWPAEAPYRRAQSSWIPLYWENWRKMGNVIFHLIKCASLWKPAQHMWKRVQKNTRYLQAAEKWACLSVVCIHGDNAWYKRADHRRAEYCRKTNTF